MARLVSEHESLRKAVRTVSAVGPEALAYACTSGSFISGSFGERAMRATMTEIGELPAVTTSGALLDALADLGVRKVAIITPYTKALTDALEDFLAEARITVTDRSYLGLTREIWRVPYQSVIEMARSGVADGADALFISCTNLPTYDVIPQLEAELRIPVISANQVTMWGALKAMGVAAVGPFQSLLDPAARTANSPIRTATPPARLVTVQAPVEPMTDPDVEPLSGQVPRVVGFPRPVGDLRQGEQADVAPL
jgi:maleate isomerase